MIERDVSVDKIAFYAKEEGIKPNTLWLVDGEENLGPLIIHDVIIDPIGGGVNIVYSSTHSEVRMVVGLSQWRKCKPFIFSEWQKIEK